ncbi:cadherin-like beta sandwich domain-containing protein [Fibrobacterota bacterium]
MPFLKKATFFSALCWLSLFCSCSTTTDAPPAERQLPVVFPDSIVADMDSFLVQIFNPGDALSPVQTVSGSVEDLSSGSLTILLSEVVADDFQVSVQGFKDNQVIINKNVEVAQGQDPVVEDVLAVATGDSTSALSSLALSPGSLSPSFDPDHISYRVALDNIHSQVTFTPAVMDSGATILLNGDTVASGLPVQVSELDTGNTYVSLRVISLAGISRNYQVIINREDYSKVKLSGLALSSGILTPAFHQDSLQYQVQLLYTDSVFHVTPGATVQASIVVNDATVIQGTRSPDINLAVGINPILIQVIGQHDLQMAYTLNVIRDPRPSSRLAEMSVFPGDLSPVFQPDSTDYSVFFTHSDSLIRIFGAVLNPLSTMAVNGVPLAPGDSSAFLPLVIGGNVIDVKVTAYDSSSTLYRISIIRADMPNAALSGLTLSEGTLEPAFHPDSTSYRVSLPHTTTAVFMTPALDPGNWAMEYEGAALGYGSSTPPLSLKIGDTTVSLTVSADSGYYPTTYSVTFTRNPDTNANLALLSLCNTCFLIPAFDKNTLDYFYNGIMGDLSVRAVTEGNATVTINGDTIVPGSTYPMTGLAPGPHRIQIEVTAQDTVTKKLYTATAVINGQGDLPPFTECTDTRVVATRLHKGIPHVMYPDCEVGNRLTVKRYAGGEWETLGAPGISTGEAGSMDYAGVIFTEMELEADDEAVYAAYRDSRGKATVKKFDSAWSVLGTESFSVDQITSLVLDVDAGVPYAGYLDGSDYVIQKYLGLSWEPAGLAPPGLSGMEVRGGEMYAAYLSGGKASVSVSTGASWDSVGTGEFSGNVGGALKFGLSGETPHVGYLDSDQGDPVIMNYSAGAWQVIKNFNPLIIPLPPGPLVKASTSSVIYFPEYEFTVDDQGSMFTAYRDTTDYASGMGIYAYNPNTWLDWELVDRRNGIYRKSFSSYEGDLIAAYHPDGGAPLIYGYWHLRPVVMKRSAR